MARMYKCTRCESVFSDDDWHNHMNATKILHGELDTKRKHLSEIHLCPECSDKAFTWLWEIRFTKKKEDQ